MHLLVPTLKTNISFVYLSSVFHVHFQCMMLSTIQITKLRRISEFQLYTQSEATMVAGKNLTLDEITLEKTTKKPGQFRTRFCAFLHFFDFFIIGVFKSYIQEIRFKSFQDFPKIFTQSDDVSYLSSKAIHVFFRVKWASFTSLLTKNQTFSGIWCQFSVRGPFQRKLHTVQNQQWIFVRNQ